MAKMKFYEEGGTGKLGKKVYYKRFGKTWKRKYVPSYNVIPTEKQAACRELFRAANEFAKGIISDPVLKALYTLKAKGRKTAYSVAISEYLFLNKPTTTN